MAKTVQKYNIVLSNKVMTKAIIFDWNGTLYEKGIGVFSFSENVLQKLKPKYKLGLVSIAKEGIEERWKNLRASGLMHYFDSVVVNTKKEKEEFLLCMKELGVKPEETIIADDRTVRGIKVGNELRCETFWIQKGPFAQELPNEETGEPTHKIDSVKVLLEYLL